MTERNSGCRNVHQSILLRDCLFIFYGELAAGTRDWLQGGSADRIASSWCVVAVVVIVWEKCIRTCGSLLSCLLAPKKRSQLWIIDESYLRCVYAANAFPSVLLICLHTTHSSSRYLLPEYQSTVDWYQMVVSGCSYVYSWLGG